LASTPSIETLNKRLRLNDTAPSTDLHLSLSAASFSFATAILNSPRAGLFSLMKVNRSSVELRARKIINVVSPSGSGELTVSWSITRNLVSIWPLATAAVSGRRCRKNPNRQCETKHWSDNPRASQFEPARASHTGKVKLRVRHPLDYVFPAKSYFESRLFFLEFYCFPR